MNPEHPNKPSKIAIFGATSEIGGEIATRMAAGNHLVLAGRRMDALEDLAARVKQAGARGVECFYFDATECASHGKLVEQIEATGSIDVALAMFGVLGDQQRAEEDATEVEKIIHTDFTAQAVLLTELSSRMKQRRDGTIVAYSSIAGARVRRPNYVYGSAKAGLDGFCQGMQDALRNTGVRLLVVRPGFVIGRMTKGMDPAPMSSTPDVVAQATVDAIEDPRQWDVWIPKKLKALAAIMPAVPRAIWRRAPR